MPSPFNLSRTPLSDDLGLGIKPSPGRGVNKDGTFNVHRAGVPRLRTYEFYHQLITMGGFRFLGVVLAGYLLTNALFAAIYLELGMENFIRPGGNGLVDRVLDAFFFSAQTLTTVGYGALSPRGHLVSAVAAIESLLGLLSLALATGLLYGRFSRPQAQIRFSRQALVAPYRGITALMFRFVNLRSNQLIEVEATVVLTFHDAETRSRQFVTLPLERKKISLFPTSWTVVHPIDEASPLSGRTEADLRATRAEVIVLIKAFDDTFAQTIYQRTSYTAEEVRWNARFVPMTQVGPHGQMEMDIGLVDAAEGVAI
ncbi:MAG: ion channel [Holophaga sp.]|jgi:inward rectifier potassium channel